MIDPIDVLEALLFASDAPVEAATIQDVLELPSIDAARELVTALRARLEQQGALQVIEAGGGFRLVTRQEVAPWLVRLARSKTKSRLSRPALETLAIIAYRQPVSRPEVDATRGVNSEAVLDNLLERRLIRIAGRKESAGRPFLYETTREFLVAFGLRDLGDLPKVDGELVVVDPAAASPATVVEGADTAGTAEGSSAGPEADGEDVDGEPDTTRAIASAGAIEATGGLELAGAIGSQFDTEAIDTTAGDEVAAAGVDVDIAIAEPSASAPDDTAMPTAAQDRPGEQRLGGERAAEVLVGDHDIETAGGAPDVEALAHDVRSDEPADAIPNPVPAIDAPFAAPTRDASHGRVAATEGGSAAAESATVADACDTNRTASSDRPAQAAAEHRAVDTEDASTAEHPAEQDPRAGGPDVAPRS